jgi:hypothetical protein
VALVTTDVTWLRWLLENFIISVSMPTPLLSDSIGAISIARDPVKHELSILVLHDHRFMMVSSLYNMCFQSSS